MVSMGVFFPNSLVHIVDQRRAAKRHVDDGLPTIFAKCASETVIAQRYVKLR